jgi:hypothetical protein
MIEEILFNINFFRAAAGLFVTSPANAHFHALRAFHFYPCREISASYESVNYSVKSAARNNYSLDQHQRMATSNNKSWFVGTRTKAGD